MEESREPVSSEDDSGAGETKNETDATSKETLSDVESDESAETSTDDGAGEKTSTPSPDGQFDEGSERDKAGPM
ncbi:MAG: hypothetical protein WCB68_05425 [Pyrinomonadaceae bacterium]